MSRGAAAPSAERSAISARRALARARRKEKAADVGAGDQQHETRGAEQQQHGRPHGADRLLGERRGANGGLRVAVGIGLAQPAADGVEIRGGLPRSDSRAQPADDLQEPRLTGDRQPVVVGAAQRQRHPELVALCREVEAGGHHADDGVGAPVGDHRAPEHRRVAGESALPERVAQHHHGVAAGLVLVAAERAAEERADGESLEEAVGHELADHQLRVVAGQREAGAHVRAHRQEGARPRLPVEEVQRRRPCAADVAAVVMLVEHQQAVRIGVRQRAQEHGVDDAEHPGVGADPQRQGDHGGRGQAGAPAEHAERLPQVLQEGVERDPDVRVAGALAHQQRVAEGLAGARAGLVRRQAFRGELPGPHVEVEPQLLVDLLRQRAGAEDVADAAEQRHRHLRRAATPGRRPGRSAARSRARPRAAAGRGE
jgi:hypothetical protein